MAEMFPNGLHMNFWIVMIIAGCVAGMTGLILGAPVLKLRGDYLAIVTLGFGEIVRIFMLNLDRPINITNGPKGLSNVDAVTVFGHSMSQRLTVGSGDWSFTFESVTLYYYLILFFVLMAIVIAHRLQDSRIGRAWMAIREDEIAAKAMGLNTRNLKLAAFGMSATFGGIAGVLFASFMRGVYPESFILMESVMVVAMVVLGGLGHIPGVILGALLLAGLPEVLRHVAGPLTELTDGRLAPEILRQLLIALAMVTVMLLRPKGLWPSPEHGKSLAK
jgi:branched-chain amino acid transport system permease protein